MGYSLNDVEYAKNNLVIPIIFASIIIIFTIFLVVGIIKGFKKNGNIAHSIIRIFEIVFLLFMTYTILFTNVEFVNHVSAVIIDTIFVLIEIIGSIYMYKKEKINGILKFCLFMFLFSLALMTVIVFLTDFISK